MKIIFQRRLNELMDENDINQTELAERIEAAYSTMSRYVNGESIPTVKNLVGIAKVFNVSTDYLVGLNNPEPTFKTERVMRRLKELELEITKTADI